ncbi:hypothetical protein MHU86_8015 [Fragilaria crotonensis]|nr:hypothetical protein MHU86_8015 [Fragilaria crotonensis]
MQQYLVLCAGVEHEDEINPALLEFRSTRQQLEDGAFVFPACDFLKERLGRGVDQRATRSLTFPERRERHLAGVPRSRPKWTDPKHVLQVAPKREVRQELFLERLARRPHDRTDDRRTSVDRAVPGAHAPPLVRRDAAQQENKIRTLCICLLPARLRRTAVAMGVRPGTVDGRVPQQTPRRTPRTLSESAARDSPAGTHAHEPSRPATSPTPASRQPATTRHETKSGLSATLPPSTRHRPTTPWRAHCRPETPTTRRHQPSQTRHARFPVSSHRWCHCRRSRSRTSTRPTTPEPRLADALATILHSGQPRTHATEFRFDWTHDAARHNLAVLKRYALDLDAALRAQPFSALTPGSEFRPTELLAPLLSAHPSGRVFRSASPKGPSPASRDLGF